MPDLAQLKCVPCRGGDPPLSDQEVTALTSDIREWQILEVEGVRRLQRAFKFKDFSEAVAFTIKIAMAAEKEDHHPLIVTEWGRVTVGWWTHVIKGLHKNDFIMAARTNKLFGL